MRLSRWTGRYLALAYAAVALVMFLLIITIPFGIASARIALFCLWPFGRTLVRRPDAGAGSLIGNIIWFVLAGWFGRHRRPHQARRLGYHVDVAVPDNRAHIGA